MTPAQRKLLALACTTGLRRYPTGQARNPPYSRIVINALQAQGLLDLDWKPTPAGRAAYG